MFPNLPLARNWGHDGSGLHGGTKESFEKNVSITIDDAKVFNPIIENDLYTPEIGKAIQDKYGHRPMLLTIRSFFRFVTYRLMGRIVLLERPNWLKWR